MGTYTSLLISGFSILSTKNSYYDEIVDLIYTESDFEEYILDDDEENERKSFISNCKICLERLELFGVTYEKAKNDFENAFRQMQGENTYKFLSNDQITFETYLLIIRKIINSDSNIIIEDPYGFFEKYLIENDLFVEHQAVNLGLWSIFYALDSECIVEYDLTDLIEAGWISETPHKLVKNEKIILFTEGKTDTEFLKNCLDIFFPYLKDFYHFIDFESSKYEANASRLVHTIKSFVGSGIDNKIIAIFDNDSAASKEIENLKKVNLPDNIKVIQYPEIEWAKNYPTLGPAGIQVMDINGLAGSIEMYLGKDCLMENGEFIPIQWTGYMESINKYQGVVLKKDQIQIAFREKVKFFDENNYDLAQWEELISIITLIKNCWK